MDKAFLYKRLVEENKTLQEVADEVGLSKQRIHQQLKILLPDVAANRVNFGRGKAVTDKVRMTEETRLQVKGRRTGHHQSDLSRVISLKFTRKRENSKRSKWDWTIKITDVDWPTHCPILGIELDYFVEARAENSPSIDRIDSSKGYIPGNVHVISWRANRIKNDGTAEEHESIARYMRQLEKTS